MSPTDQSKFQVGDVVRLTDAYWQMYPALADTLVVVEEFDLDGVPIFFDTTWGDFSGVIPEGDELVYRAGSVEAAHRWTLDQQPDVTADDVPNTLGLSIRDAEKALEILANTMNSPSETVPPTKRREALMKAADLIDGDRNKEYGEPADNFGRIASFWSTYTQSEVTPVDVAVMMALVKIARLVNTPDHQDSYIDLAGYAAIGAELTNES